MSVGKFLYKTNFKDLVPFLFLCFLGFVIFPILKRSFGEILAETAIQLFYVFFLNNFDIIKKRFARFFGAKCTMVRSSRRIILSNLASSDGLDTEN